MVLQVSSDYKNILATEKWEDVAEELICRFEMKSDFKNVFGAKEHEQKAPAGYTHCYHYGSHSFYLAVAYHQYMTNMGVVIKFSAQSLDYYCQMTGLKVYEFMQKVVHADYTLRLSRIDLTADYINEGIDITNIYQNFMDRKVAIFRECRNKKTNKLEYKKIPIQFEGILKAEVVPTLYLGSVQSNARCRIYDKKREQIERKGTKYDKAIMCKDWVRIEGVFRNEYAHQLSHELMQIKNDDEFANLIAQTLSQKYMFMNVKNGVADCPTEYAQMLIDCVTNASFALKATSTKNFELIKSVLYLINGSGILNTLYKLEKIWGIDAVIGLLEYLIEVLQNVYKANDDCQYWLKKNREDYQKNYPTFEMFMKDNISVLP